jgi:hypothetical protein
MNNMPDNNIRSMVMTCLVGELREGGVRVSVWERQQQTLNDGPVHRIVKFHKIRSNYLFGKAIGSSSLGFWTDRSRWAPSWAEEEEPTTAPYPLPAGRCGGSRFLLCCTTHDLSTTMRNQTVPIAIATTFVSGILIIS